MNGDIPRVFIEYKFWTGLTVIASCASCALWMRTMRTASLEVHVKQTMATAALIVLSIAAIHGQKVVLDMTPQLIAEAIQAGERGRVPPGVLSEKSGWSWGSLHIATFSTPFMRVAAAAGQAKKEYKRFAAAEVTAELIAPELHVYAWATTEGVSTSNVSAVVITPKKGSQAEKMERAVHPTRFEPIPQQFQNLFGATAQGVGRMAVFPLSALSQGNEVHVVYDRSATIGGNAAGGVKCDDCKAGFNLSGVR